MSDLSHTKPKNWWVLCACFRSQFDPNSLVCEVIFISNEAHKGPNKIIFHANLHRSHNVLHFQNQRLNIAMLKNMKVAHPIPGPLPCLGSKLNHIVYILEV